MMTQIEDWRKRHCPKWIGNSSETLELFRLVMGFCEAEDPILITGETGTGKELIARAIHSGSGCNGLFVAVNCAALNTEMLLSDLCGHLKGAFTSAHRTHDGLLKRAARGTLFLDEVADMPPNIQGALLRIIETKEFRAVGSVEDNHFSGRIIAATNKSLEAEIDAHRFRSDLFYRLDVLSVHLPPLRDRKPDIVQMARQFAAPRVISPRAEEMLRKYAWPGNVRELQHTIKRALASTKREVLDTGDIIFRKRAKLASVQVPEDIIPLRTALNNTTTTLITKALQVTGGNRQAASVLLGLNRTTLHEMILKHKITEEEHANPGCKVSPESTSAV